MPDNPMQPIIRTNDGVVRFQRNAIVRALLDFSSLRGFDMNTIAMLPFSQEDRCQFAQLIGHSICGYHELSYVSDEHAAAASAEAKKLDPKFGGCRDSGCEIHGGVAKE